MSDHVIRPLDSSTIHALHAGQVIVDIDAIVKELVENSIDAQASNIEVKLVNHGLESIQVKDNGCGIHEQDRKVMARRHYTSKIASFKDLDHLATLGFRGEALNAICAVAEHMELTTKTAQDPVGKCYSLNRTGEITSDKISADIPRTGTIVTVERPFYNIPVRRQMAEKSASSTAKRIQLLLTRYSLSFPEIRFSFTQTTDTMTSRNKDIQWTRPSCVDTMGAIAAAYGAQLSGMLDYYELAEEHPVRDAPLLSIACALPKKNSDPTVIYHSDRAFVYVNRRPINPSKSDLKEIIILLRKRYKEAIGLLDDYPKKVPFLYLDIRLHTDQYDVNVEPTKNAVMLHHKQRIVNLFEKLLDRVYGTLASRFFNLISDERPETSPEPVEPSSSEQKKDQTIPEAADHQISIPISNEPEPCPRNGTHVAVEEIQHLEDKHGPEPEPWNAGPRNDVLAAVEEIQHLEDKRGPELDEPVPMSADPRNDTHVAVGEVEHLDDEFEPEADDNQSQRWKFSMYSQESVDSEATDADREQELLVTETPVEAPTSASILSKWLNSAPKNKLPQDQSLKSSTPPPRRQTTSIGVSGGAKPIQRSTCAAPTSERPQNLIKQETLPIFLENEMDWQIECIEQPQIAGQPARPVEENTSITTDQQHRRTSLKRTRKESFDPRRRRRSDSPSVARRSSLPSDRGASFNASGPIHCNPRRIKEDYLRREQRLSQLYGAGLEAYSSRINEMTSAAAAPIVVLQEYPLEAGLSIYAKCLHTHEAGRVVQQIGIIDMKRARRLYTLNKLLESHEISCKKRLEKPVEMKIRKQDALYPVVMSLKGKEQRVLDDGHGRMDCLYTAIVDKRITANGFQCRWRKDDKDDVIVQITCTCDIGHATEYGIDDFRELLAKIRDCHPFTLSALRTSKLKEYFKRLADLDVPRLPDEEMLAVTLDSLVWSEGPDGPVGVHLLSEDETAVVRLLYNT